MVQYIQTSENYFQKVYANGKKVRVSRNEFIQNVKKGGSNNNNNINQPRLFDKDHKIHSDWYNKGKRMEPVAFIKSPNKIFQVKLAEKIQKSLNLNSLEVKNRKVNPVWVQEIKSKQSYYYIIFVAIRIGNGINKFLKEGNKNNKLNDIFREYNTSKNLFTYYPSLRSNITKLMQPKNTTKSYVNNLEQLMKKYKLKIS